MELEGSEEKWKQVGLSGICRSEWSRSGQPHLSLGTQRGWGDGEVLKASREVVRGAGLKAIKYDFQVWGVCSWVG